LITSTSHNHFLHMNVLLRHACGGSADSERDVETILTEAALGKRRLWVTSILFAELRPSTFVRGPFQTIAEFANYIRGIATFVTPDPNTMLRVARLRDVEWRRPAALRKPGEKPRFMSLVDALQIASALWVKEALAIADLEFLAFEELKSDDAEAGGRRMSLLRLQDYTEAAPVSSDVLAAVELTRVEPVLQPRQVRQSMPAV
jgi:hypothetical protein